MNELLYEFGSRYWFEFKHFDHTQEQVNEIWAEFLDDAAKEFRNRVHEL